MMSKAILGAAATALVTWTSPAQSPPDIFSCVEPSRLAVGTTTYDLSGVKADMTVAKLREGNQSLVQVAWKPLPTIESATDILADSFVPIRMRTYSTSESNERRLVIDLTLADAEIRGSRGGQPVSVPTGGQRVVFGGPYFLDVMAGAVNWDRCPSVTARHMVQYQLVTTTLRHVSATTLSHQGMPVAVSEIEIVRPQRVDKVWVTRSAPHFLVQFTSGTGSLVTFVSRHTP